jgi:enolase-phosphatase E1
MFWRLIHSANLFRFMSSIPTNAGIRGILLDIEGTVTPISFVHEILFPYARSHVRDYLAAQFDSAETISDLARLRNEHALDVQEDREPPPLVDGPRDAVIDSIVSYVLWLMDRDRKSAGLKSLQGKIWEQGYLDGSLTAPLFAGVLPAIEKARHAGLKIAIFSSGSIFAQRLLFAHTNAGDLAEFIDAYFDTTTGPKTEPESYRRIAAALHLRPPEVLFISDIVAELDAASKTGMQTLLCIRPGNHPVDLIVSHTIIRSFSDIEAIFLT